MKARGHKMRPHTRTQCQDECAECNAVAAPDSDVFVQPPPPPPSAASETSGRNYAEVPGLGKTVPWIELPAEILVKIIKNLTFSEISSTRLVSRRFNEICASILNSTFSKLQSLTLERLQMIKSQMPRRESARRNHPLARESDIVETVHMRLSLLQMTFGKHIERKHVCFFAGGILDEVYRIMCYIRQTPSLGRAYGVTDELCDLTTMAMEYFKENIERTLPDITFRTDFLDFTTPFISPSKRRKQSGAGSSCSSRASVAGSSCSEPWSATQQDETRQIAEAGGSNMVLRRRIRIIGQDMKRYDDEMVEVKRDLKSYKAKVEAQDKQLVEYNQRVKEYDKKFEDTSRKFRSLLAELNKCKAEMQFWRSKSAESFPSVCIRCSAPVAVQIDGLEGEGGKEDTTNRIEDLKTIEEAPNNSDLRPQTRSGPPSPMTVSRKRSRASRGTITGNDEDKETSRKSPRGAGVKCNKGKRAKAMSTNA